MDQSRVFKFILATCLCLSILAGQQTGECRRNKTSAIATARRHNKTQDNDSDKDNSSDLEGASRVDGGFLANSASFPFLGTLWARGYNGSDGRFAGHAIGLGGPNMIVHQHSLDRLSNTPNLNHGMDGPDRIVKSDLTMEQYSFPTPNRIDIFKQKLPITDNKIDAEPDTTLGGSQFRLATITKPEYMRKLPNFAAPKLEHDKNEFGSNCKGYGYSIAPIEKSIPGSARDFVSFSMKKQGDCNLGHCKLSSDQAGECHHMSDHGMPVLCGPEQKLTYMIKSRSRDGEVGCKGEFEAFHVPHMVDDLRRLNVLPNQG